MRGARGRLAAAVAAAAIVPAGGAEAVTLSLPPGAERTAFIGAADGSAALPAGPWRPGGPPLRRAEGTLSREAWRIPLPPGGLPALVSALAAELRARGHAIVYECADRDCGGFDFRFGLDVLPEPAMHVDIGDFRYLLAEAEDGSDLVALLASRARDTGYLQITRIATRPPAALSGNGAAASPAPRAPAAPADPGDLGARLEAEGAVALDDLAFEPGAARLGPGPFASLAALAAYLRADPARRIVLVGHSDAVGPLAANIALSRQRAEAVAERLVAAHGVPRAQVSAEGVGFLAPRASNLTEAGRARNRRVEAVLALGP